MEKLPILKLKWGVILSGILLLVFVGCKANLSPLQNPTATSFPWPPPHPSTKVPLYPNVLMENQSLMNIDSVLVRVLDKAGYSGLIYFPISSSDDENGFVLTTPMEETNGDETSKNENERWNLNIHSANFSVGEDFKTDISDHKRFFRRIVFTVTDSPFNQTTKSNAKTTLLSESSTLPDSIGQIPINSNYQLTALIYLYEQEANTDIAKLQTTDIDEAHTQLALAYILDEIEPKLQATPSSQIPEFRLPPPKPSVWNKMDPKFFTKAKTLEDVNAIISKGLVHGKYRPSSYFRVPSSKNYGFALVTQMERMNADATSNENGRWKAEYAPSAILSFSDYLRALFYTNKGYYRIIVFVVTDESFNYKPTAASRKEAAKWMDNGKDELPKSIGSLPFTQNHQVRVLIYEYELEENERKAKLVKQSDHSVEDHLEKAKITEELSKN